MRLAMRTAAVVAVVIATGGCAKKASVTAVSPAADRTTTSAQAPGLDVAQARDSKPIATSEPRGAEPAAHRDGPWIGAATESELLMRGTRETLLGVWVDVPEARPAARPPVDLALVIDTSGSMAGSKIENARAAARMLVQNLSNGDIVALDTFSDRARTIAPPTVIDSDSRADVLRAIAALGTGGSTNMFEGLTLGESHMAQAPATHTVRRVVVISDGIANVGPSTPESLGAIAERGLRFRAQVTSLGVGTDYDEHTLNALAVRSSGRLFHLSEPREMANILKHELDLLSSTLASDATVEVVPAPGVQLLGADGIRADFQGDGALRIPLGALYGGQHREALVRVRVNEGGRFEGNAKPLASVRLRFRDPSDGDIERIQEVVARMQFTDDSGAVARSVNARTQSIAVLQDTAKVQMQAAQSVNQGQFLDADKELAVAQRKLDSQAAATADVTEKRRLTTASASIGAARASVAAAPAKPKAAQRDDALKMNSAGMSQMGF